MVEFLPTGSQFLVVQWCTWLWRLDSSVDAPPGIQSLPLPALRVVGQLPTSVQSRCTTHSGSTRLLHCRNQDPIWLSVPTRASQSVSETAYRDRHHIQRRWLQFKFAMVRKGLLRFAVVREGSAKFASQRKARQAKIRVRSLRFANVRSCSPPSRRFATVL